VAWLVGLVTFASAVVLVWSVTLWRASDEDRGPRAIAVVVAAETSRASSLQASLPAGRPYDLPARASRNEAEVILRRAAVSLTEQQGQQGWQDPDDWFADAWVASAVRPVVTAALDRAVAPWWSGARLNVVAAEREASVRGVAAGLPWDPADANPDVGAYRALLERFVEAYLAGGREEAVDLATSVPLRVRLLQGFGDAERALAGLYLAAPNALEDALEADLQTQTRRRTLTGDTREAAAAANSDALQWAQTAWGEGFTPRLDALEAQGLAPLASTRLGAQLFDRAAHARWQTVALASGAVTLVGLVLLVVLGRGAGRLIRAGMPLFLAGVPGVLLAGHALIAPNATLPSGLPYAGTWSAARDWMLLLDGAAWEVAWVHAILLAAGVVLTLAGVAVWLRGSGRPT
jgi:hypothetical protein